MKFLLKVIVPLVLFILVSFTPSAPSSSYKCMIQMINYTGEGAYIAISLIDAEGNYEKTLYVHGDDNEWYHDIIAWWKFYGKRRPNIDAIVGATMSGGQRNVSIIQIDNDKINTGYSIRFESAVEDQGYHKDDIQFELTTESIQSKVEGKGFIRYVRMMPQ